MMSTDATVKTMGGNNWTTRCACISLHLKRWFWQWWIWQWWIWQWISWISSTFDCILSSDDTIFPHISQWLTGLICTKTTHCNAMQRTATHRNALQRTTHQPMFKRTHLYKANTCNTPQNTAKHCNAPHQPTTDYRADPHNQTSKISVRWQCKIQYYGILLSFRHSIGTRNSQLQNSTVTRQVLYLFMGCCVVCCSAL